MEKKFEYWRLDTVYLLDVDELDEKWGQYGWELVSVVKVDTYKYNPEYTHPSLVKDYVYYFKREK